MKMKICALEKLDDPSYAKDLTVPLRDGPSFWKTSTMIAKDSSISMMKKISTDISP